MKLGELLTGAASVSVSGDSAIDVLGLALDSRNVRPGSAFFALPGSRTDGNRFVRDAVEKGAVAVFSELKNPPAPMTLIMPGSREKTVAWIQVRDIREAMGRIAANYFGDPSAAMTIVGVTGTNGKTTTAYFLESIFSRAGGAPGVIGTVSHRLRMKPLEKALNTTPLSLDLIRLLAGMRDAGATHVAMEVSSHALAGKRADEVRFDAAVLTNVHQDHLDFHKTREAYFDAKARLFELLERADSVKKNRVAVLNRDDETFSRLKRRVLGVRLVSYGLGPESDYHVAGAVYSLSGTTFRVVHGDAALACRIRLPGEHNLRNALAAAAAARELGLGPEAVVEGLAAVEKVPGRLEPVDAGQNFSVFVDFAHTESALAQVLDSLKRLPHRRIITVFGCGGDRDKTKRGPMGAAAAAGSDHAIATSDNPRGEDPLEILRLVEDGMRGGGRSNYKIVPDRRDAIHEAMRIAQKDDVVLIAGKGHEDVQILRDGSVPFDDRSVARQALKDCGKS